MEGLTWKRTANTSRGKTRPSAAAGHAAHLARERMDVRLARYDVTPAQTHVLLYLGEQSGPTPQRDVVEHLRIKPPRRPTVFLTVWRKRS